MFRSSRIINRALRAVGSRSLAQRTTLVPPTIVRASSQGHVLNRNLNLVQNARNFATAKDDNVSPPEAEKPGEAFTYLSEENDPEREAFFKYTWGSWLENNAAEHEQRITRFSIPDAIELIKTIGFKLDEVMSTNPPSSGIPSLKVDKDAQIPPLTKSGNGITFITQNIHPDVIGETSGLGGEPLTVKRMLSIHEGRHHRIYRLDVSNGKSFILRIPYPLKNMTETARKYRLMSEVATMDFLSVKTGMDNIPKVLAYGADSNNSLKTQFILEEFIDGNLLMRQWDPNFEDKDLAKVQGDVFLPVVDIVEKIIETTFNKIGSLFFKEDLADTRYATDEPAYSDETNESVKGRWVIGPSTEAIFWKGKSFPEADTMRGPWKTTNEFIDATIDIEIASFRNRLVKEKANGMTENVEKLEFMIDVMQKYKVVAPVLLNPGYLKPTAAAAVYAYKLFNPDIDPLNIIMKTDEGTGSFTPYIVDFEGTSIKPFIYHTTPAFVDYSGPKIFDLKEEVPNYDELTPAEKAEVDFVYKKTRNQNVYESLFASKKPSLISAYAPVCKNFRNPYRYLLNRKFDNQISELNENLLTLDKHWKLFCAVTAPISEDGKTPLEYPVKYTDAEMETQAKYLNAWNDEVTKKPFLSTKGWIPQDLFDELMEKGFLLPSPSKEGDFIIKPQDPPAETASESEKKD